MTYPHPNAALIDSVTRIMGLRSPMLPDITAFCMHAAKLPGLLPELKHAEAFRTLLADKSPPTWPIGVPPAPRIAVPTAG